MNTWFGARAVAGIPARFEASVTVCGVALAKVTVSPAPTVAEGGVGPVGVSETLTLAAAATPATARAATPVAAMIVRLVVRFMSIPGLLTGGRHHTGGCAVRCRR